MNAGNNRSRKVMISSIVVIAVLLIGIVAWRALAGRTPGPQDGVAFVASEKFRELPAEEKQNYVEKVFDEDPQRQKALRNMAEAHRQKLLDDYFALPEGKARQDFLDKQIDRMEEIRKMMDNPSTQPGERIVIKKGGASAAVQKELTETVPAEYQGKMAQYMKDLKDRRAARGLPTEGPGAGGAIMIRIGTPK